MALTEELDFDYRTQEQNREGDKNLAVKFYTDAILNQVKSTEAGRPIYDDVEMIEKRVRGDRNNIAQRPVQEEDRRRWPELYRAFKANEDAPSVGTPLKEWPSLPKSLVLELQYLGFNTVEDVSNATDAVCSKMAGLQGLKQRAKLWIEAQAGGAPMGQMQAKIEEQANELEVLRRQNAAMNERLESFLAEQSAGKTPQAVATAKK
jgi:hypothetical protein